MTDDARTDAEQMLIDAMQAALKDGYVAPSPYIYGLEDLPPIGVRRGGIRFPQVQMHYTLKRVGWRRWFVRVNVPGDAMIHSVGPFTTRRKAEFAKSALFQLYRAVDYAYTYKTGA